MNFRHLAIPLLAAALLTACETDTKPSGLAARDWLVRASLDMRGTRPTLEELDAIQADPSRVDAIVASLVDDARVEQRVRSIFAAAFRTRRDAYYWSGEDLGLDEEQEGAFQRALAEEVPSLIAHVALSDAPFTCGWHGRHRRNVPGDRPEVQRRGFWRAAEGHV
jgi:hypothetical protein